jgi:heme-degrading monooxygenase HmoA
VFGTVGRAHVKPENRDKLVEEMGDPAYTSIPGYRTSFLMFPENRENEVLIVAMFEDAASYWKNADDPAQDERYRRFRALLEDDPEWSDGEWLAAPEGTA